MRERESDSDFLWVNGVMWEEEVSEGAHVGTTTNQGAPGGPGAPRWVVPTWCTSLRHYLHQKFRNIQKKSY